MIRNLCLTILAVGFALGTPSAQAHEATVREMAAASSVFLNSLDAERKAKAVFEWKDGERVNWHYIPKARKGLALKNMNDAQRALAHGLIVTGLSHQGYRKALQVMSLEQILFEMGDNPKTRDPGNYFISIFGTPAPKGTWGWRLEGHHLSLNYTVIKGTEVSVTPSFYATNPGRVNEGAHKGLQVLAAEENLARTLANSLTEEQLKTALVAAEAPADIITKADRTVKPLEPMGLAYTALTDDQKKQLTKLVNTYLRKHRPAIAKAELKRIETAGWDKVHFAWAGGLKKGQGHYYRIQTPHLLLEYDNTQGGANHVHAVMRDFTNDFGDDLLKKHHAENH